LAVGGDHRLCRAVDLGDAGVQQQPDPLVAGVVVAGQGQQLAVPAFGVGGQSDAVIGRVGLLGQHGDPPGRVGVAGSERLDQSMAHHAVPGHDEVAGRGTRARLVDGSHGLEGRKAILRKCR
jgi:hypothetical protein